MVFNFIFEVIGTWFFTIFAAPFVNLELLWILIPVYASWFFAEFFQEKTGTSLGNAISNAVVVLWASVDFLRTTVHTPASATAGFIAKIVLCGLIFAYGILIIIQGVKTAPITRYIGRVREVTYVVAIFAPVIYNVVDFDLKFVLGAVLFAPVYYFTIELFCRYTPNPRAIVADMQGEPHL